MYKWLGTHPMVVILLPLIVLLVVLDSLQIPIHPYHKPIVALPDSVQTYQLVTQTYPSEHKKTWRVEASIISPQYHPTHPPHVYLYIHKDSSLVLPSLQDTLIVHTRFQSADTIGTFDYNKYLQHQGICAIGFVDSQHWFIHNACTSNRWHPKAWQYQLHQYLQSLGIQGAELGTLSALTLGYKEDLEPDIQRSFSAAGATHVLAVSGLHTGILYTIIIMFLTGMGRWRPLYEEKWKRRVLSLCVIICLVLYALLTGATLLVGRIKGIDRPALAGILPAYKSQLLLMDCGSNTNCKPINLLQFAQMSTIYLRNTFGIEKPRIGLLNIGTEETKGNELVRESYKLLKEKSEELGINFIGNVEGRDAFSGKIDAIVTDGFTGNVFLKTTEGLGKLVKTLKIGIGTATDFLKSKGFTVEEDFNAKITGEQEALLLKEFATPEMMAEFEAQKKEPKKAKVEEPKKVVEEPKKEAKNTPGR